MTAPFTQGSLWCGANWYTSAIKQTFLTVCLWILIFEEISMTMNHEEILEQLQALMDPEYPVVSNLANAAALLYEKMEQVNWAGFYLMHAGRLVLGPFQGNPACIHIEIGKGVCGTAVQEKRIIRVADVHQFPGHIACDSASRSEIVLPLEKDGEIFGVLDIDSQVLDRFSEEDEAGLKEIAELLQEMIDLRG